MVLYFEKKRGNDLSDFERIVAVTSLEENDGLHLVYQTGLLVKQDDQISACSQDGQSLMELTIIESVTGRVSSRSSPS